jgi:phage tail tape-measure protein
MKTNKPKKDEKKKKAHVAHEAEGVASGAAAGAVLGAGAGPAGIVAGAIIGGVAGAVAASALEKDAALKAAHARELDEQIGVTGGISEHRT